MLCLVLIIFCCGLTVAGIVRMASTPSWDALTTRVPAPRALLTPGERAAMLAKAGELRDDVDWCLRRAAAAERRAVRAHRGRTRLLKEADVFQRAARELAQDALALVNASERR